MVLNRIPNHVVFSFLPHNHMVLRNSRTTKWNSLPQMSSSCDLNCNSFHQIAILAAINEVRGFEMTCIVTCFPLVVLTEMVLPGEEGLDARGALVGTNSLGAVNLFVTSCLKYKHNRMVLFSVVVVSVHISGETQSGFPPPTALRQTILWQAGFKSQSTGG